MKDAGHEVGEGRVHRLCKEHKIYSTTTKKGRKYSAKRPGEPVHDDLIQRDFTAPAPDLVWLTAVTEHPTLEGKLYLCSIKDVFSNRIVGYGISNRMTRRLATGTVIVHSDRGGQFRSRELHAILKAAGLKGSMGRVASAADNAAMESFYSLLQQNVLNCKTWKTRDDLAYEIIYWIEHTYNRRHRQRGLGTLTPVEFELAFASQEAVAA